VRFDPKISTLEEKIDLDSISMDELHRIFTTYEMRTAQKKLGIKEQHSKHLKGQIKRSRKNKKNITTTVTSQKMMKK